MVQGVEGRGGGRGGRAGEWRWGSACEVTVQTIEKDFTFRHVEQTIDFLFVPLPGARVVQNAFFITTMDKDAFLQPRWIKKINIQTQICM